MEKILEINNLYKKYNKADKFAVTDISLTINSGEVVGIVGKNGAGKSTIIKCVVGLEKITNGQVQICGYDIVSSAVQAKKCFSYVPDESFALDNMTGFEYINFVADVFEMEQGVRQDKLSLLQEKYQLGDSIFNLIKTYSHGMKQKIGIMTSCIVQPKLWILDEPITGLDPQTIVELKNDINEYKKSNNAVIFATHNLSIAQDICTRIIIVNSGRIVDDITTKQLKQKNKTLEEYFIEKCNA